MSKSQNKTIENDLDPRAFLQRIEDEGKRADAIAVLDLMGEITKEEPKMWGTSIVGFGRYHYKYDSGREGDFMKVGFSPRKQNLTLYIMPGFGRYEELMSSLGKYKTGKSCLYIKRLEDVDVEVLKELVASSFEYMSDKYDKESR